MRNLTLFRNSTWKTGVRRLATLADVKEPQDARRCQGRMSGWQIHSYSENTSDLQLAQNLKKPHIRSPSELLVKVHASSVNPIDVAMMSEFYSKMPLSEKVSLLILCFTF